MNAERPAPPGLILASAFLSGAAVMVVEMTAVRMLQPFVGSTNYVWTNVIAVVLAALATGYWLGGRLADARPRPSTYFGLLAAGGLLTAASAWFATPVARWLQPGTADLEGVVTPLVLGSLAATLILFGPAMAVLGGVSPVAVRLLADAGAGRAAGRVFAISTAGSIVGTYLPILWLIQDFGSRKSVLFAAALLLVPAVVGLVLTSGPKGSVNGLAALALAATGSAFAGTQPSRGAPKLEDGGVATVLHEDETPYQYVTVRKDDYGGRTEKLFTINEGVYTYHSFEIVGSVLTNSRYYDSYSVLPLLVDVPDGEELRGCVVGLACGVTPRQWIHFWGKRWKLAIDGAEIDPAVIAIGRKYFHLADSEQAGLRSYAMDGRQLLAALPESRRYHMIAVDAFANELYIPFHLGTLEFFRLCRDHLEPGGVFAMNVYAQQADAPNLAAIENTMATAFGSCLRIRQTWGGNFFLVARKGDAPADMTRLVPSRIADRCGRPADVTEWDTFVDDVAAPLPWAALRIDPDPAKFLLTDDHAPLEHLTDLFLKRTESEVRGR